MATVRAICPYCSREERLSIVVAMDGWAPLQRREWLLSAPIKRHRDLELEVAYSMRCHMCGGNSIGIFAVNQAGVNLLSSGIDNATGIEGYPQRARLEHIIPEAGDGRVSDAIPERAAIFFAEAKHDLRSGRDPAGIISKCRSVLGLCLKELNASGNSRKARIQDLRQKGLLTESLGEWASRLWDDGNDAIHDLVGDAGAARQHVAFLDLFFEVAFVLPAQIEQAQGATAEGDQNVD